MSSLPSFLQPLDGSDATNLPYMNAIFRHKAPLGPVHALWWPCQQLEIIIAHIFEISMIERILGNPGLLGFYPPFLTAIQNKASSVKLAILAQAHVGHTPGVGNQGERDAQRYGLTTQTQNAIEAFDALRSTFSANTKVLVLGHSIGSWLALQVLKARPKAVCGSFLLFPTISHIGSTPNGRSLSWMFCPPVPRIISAMSSVARIPPTLLSWLFWSWPRSQITVLHSLLSSPSAIFAAICMGYDEMINVRELDTSLLNEHRDRIWFYYAEKDDWVDDQREVVLRAINAHPGYLRVVHGHKHIPHAFCINHGEQLAAQCYEWLVAGEFIQEAAP